MRFRTRTLIFAALLFGAVNLFAQTNPPPVAKPGPALVPAMRATPTNWLSRHEGFVAQAKKGGVDILFLGDSITDNWRSRGSNVWDKYYAPRHAANFGIGGDRTQHVLWRIEHGELDGIHPKVVVLMIGTNNSNDDSPQDIAAAIKMIIDVIDEKIPKTKILLLAIFPRGPHANPAGATDDGTKRMATIHAVNQIISHYDDGGKTVKYLDIGAKFLGEDGKLHTDVMSDLLYPTEKGYQIWADAMEPTLDEMLK